MRGKSLTQEQRMAKLGYVTAAFAAEVLGVSKQAISLYIKQCKLRAVPVGRRRFITQSSLNRMLDAHVRQKKVAAKTPRRAQ